MGTNNHFFLFFVVGILYFYYTIFHQKVKKKYLFLFLLYTKFFDKKIAIYFFPLFRRILTLNKILEVLEESDEEIENVFCKS
jgi:hypothetical protein